MILKNFLIVLGILVAITSSDPQFGNHFSFKSTSAKDNSFPKEYFWHPLDHQDHFLSNHDKLHSGPFRITPYFKQNVQFWFWIYTKFSSSQVIFHDKDNLFIIYKILDFTSLQQNLMSLNALYVLQQVTASAKLESLKRDLESLANNPGDQNHRLKYILQSLDYAGVTLPSRSSWKSFFLTLRNNVRTQTGQRNFIQEGLRNSISYRSFIQKIFHERNIPAEIFAVSFLESSFNPLAQSRAGAAGIWQLMPFIAHHYLPRYGDALDTRFNIILSSIAAAHLMTDNYRVMKSWDLAIAAYNSGTKHLLKTKREIGDTSSNLESIIKHSDSAHFGFASKNFYSEFLALTRVLAYKELIFPEVSAKDESFVFRFFMSKCSIKPSLAISMDTLVELKTLNHNIKDFTQTLPRGFVLVAKSDLPKQMFLEISFNDAVHIRPKEWSKLLKNQSCSTR